MTDTKSRPARRKSDTRVGKTPHQVPATAPQPAAGGLHWRPWAAELGGTAFQLFLGFSLVVVLVAPSSRFAGLIPGGGPTRLVIGLGFGVLAALVAISPPGRLSGAHLNPAVTFAFWIRGHVHPIDLLGYTVAQTAGAFVAAGLVHVLWGQKAARLHDVATFPVSAAWQAFLAEALLSAALLVVVFALVSHQSTARFTPAVVAVLLSGLIWAGGPYSGPSMNPARSLAPDTTSGAFSGLWIYLVAPMVGAALAVAVFRIVLPNAETLTAKLFHDERYPTSLASALPAQPHDAKVNHHVPPTSKQPRR